MLNEERLPRIPRQRRIEYEGAIYHVMNRGDRREEIVLGDEDRELFVATLAETCVRCGWGVHVWCLMNNHFHLVWKHSGKPDVENEMVFGAYTMRFNARDRMAWAFVCRALQVAHRR